jgi:hypothetical protein
LCCHLTPGALNLSAAVASPRERTSFDDEAAPLETSRAEVRRDASGMLRDLNQCGISSSSPLFLTRIGQLRDLNQREQTVSNLCTKRRGGDG